MGNNTGIKESVLTKFTSVTCSSGESKRVRTEQLFQFKEIMPDLA